MQYGFKNDKIVDILEISPEESGLKCNCICPLCATKLQAKLGKGHKRPHFSHNNKNCDPHASLQTSLHLLAKEIIESEKNIVLPPIIINFEESQTFQKLDSDERNIFKERIAPYVYRDSQKINFDEVKLEQKISNIVPDIVLTKGTKQCLVEIAVTHFVNIEKKRKIEKLGLAVCEIDLQKHKDCNFDKEKLKDLLINEHHEKSWIYNPLYNEGLEIAEIYFQEQLEKQKENELSKKKRTSELQKKQDDKWKKAEHESKKRVREKAEQYNKEIDQKTNGPEIFEDDRALAIYQSTAMFKESVQIPLFCNIPIESELLFDCDRRIWQTKLFDRFIYNNVVNKKFGYIDVCKWALEQKDFKVKLRGLYGRTIDVKRLLIIKKIIKSYLLHLDSLGFIKCESSHFYLVNSKTLIPSNSNIDSKGKIELTK